jgi:class 3 adenylate cyclase/tetratricopeptide (TPR) repeat protein
MFADVTGSTAVGERVDPESLRRIMSRYFETMGGVIERHGGTVEKFIGDAVMAIFGVPRLHEDDALRAARAACDMRDALRPLNDELAHNWGVQLALRIGVNTGEVVAGDASAGHAIVTGDAVNVAKRLEETAQPGEILIGDTTRRLVRDAALLEPIDPVAAKGKAAPVEAWRLREVVAGAAGIARRLDSPLVGRQRELEALRDAFDRALEERTCHLVTVFGAAGIGKSRLASEFMDTIRPAATALTGRCLPYGDGITFWPLAEAVRDAGGEDALRTALASADDGDVVAERIRGAIGVAGTAGRPEETSWAVRRFFEELARERPLVVCFEDIHWAEPTFLDLIEYLAGWSRAAPMLILCLARPEFSREQRSWLVEQPNTTSLTLEPLTERESETLIDHLAAGAEIVADTRLQIADAAEGNPLFVEQMVAMVAERGGDGRIATPPSIQALLDARLDRLAHGERAVLERASVIGKEFWRRPVLDLSPVDERAAVDGHLLALVRKDLIHAGRSHLWEDAFAFRHVLIRDAAYGGMPKEVRAELHEQFAAWLEEHASGRSSELEEIIGYHLEQAFRYREQLGPVDDRDREVAVRAGEFLGRAGRRAFARGDMPAAIKLLDRALSLLTDQHPVRLELMRELSSAFWAVGELARAEALINGLLEVAAATADRRVEWFALLERAGWRSMTDPGATEDELSSVAAQATEVFEELGDDLGLARAWRQMSLVPRARGRLAEAVEASERALSHARRAGDTQEEARAIYGLCASLVLGPLHAAEAIRRCEDLLAQAGTNRLLEANVDIALAELTAMRGEFDEARAFYRRAMRIYEDHGLRLPLVACSETVATVEMLAGDAETAERELRRGLELLSGDNAMVAFQAGLLAEVVLAQSRETEAEELARDSEGGAGNDVTTQMRWRATRARLEARRGEIERAVELAREAVRLVAETDALNLRADALVALGDVLSTGGRDDEAAAVLREACELYERKGNLAAAARTESLLVQAIG